MQAPWLFFSTLVVLCSIITVIIYRIFKGLLGHKDALIKTLQDQLQSAKSGSAPLPAVQVSPASFRLLIPGANIFIPEQAPHLTGIALDVIVTNTGKPSVALDWKLSVIPKVGLPQLAQLTKMPTSLVARGEHNTAHISASESLVDSTQNDPLQTDTPRTGKLLFYIALPKPDVITSVFELSVTDVSGKLFMERKDLNEWLSR